MQDDPELNRLREIRAARIRLGLEKPEAAHKGMPQVTVYTTNTCPYCHMAKTYLSERKIGYKEINLTNSPQEAMRMVQATGETGVPQLNINGEWILGFDRKAIDRALGI